MIQEIVQPVKELTSMELTGAVGRQKPAMVPEVAKVLGINCPRCFAPIGNYCNPETQMICAERLASVIAVDAQKVLYSGNNLDSQADDFIG